MTKLEAATDLNAAGLVAGPSFNAPEVIADPHIARAQHARGDAPHRRRARARAHPRQPGEDVEGRRRPRDRACRGSASTPIDVLAADLGLSGDEIAALRDEGAIG